MRAIALVALTTCLLAPASLASADQLSTGNGAQHIHAPPPPRPPPPPICHSQREMPTLEAAAGGKLRWVCVFCPPPRRPWRQGVDAYGYANWVCRQ